MLAIDSSNYCLPMYVAESKLWAIYDLRSQSITYCSKAFTFTIVGEDTEANKWRISFQCEPGIESIKLTERTKRVWKNSNVVSDHLNKLVVDCSSYQISVEQRSDGSGTLHWKKVGQYL